MLSVGNRQEKQSASALCFLWGAGERVLSFPDAT
jgi:hypothetical protein